MQSRHEFSRATRRDASSRYLASHLRNYSVGFIPREERHDSGFRVAEYTHYTLQLGANFSRQKINIQPRDDVTSGETFRARIRRTVTFLWKNDPRARLHTVSVWTTRSCKVPHARHESLEKHDLLRDSSTVPFVKRGFGNCAIVFGYANRER